LHKKVDFSNQGRGWCPGSEEEKEGGIRVNAKKTAGVHQGRPPGKRTNSSRRSNSSFKAAIKKKRESEEKDRQKPYYFEKRRRSSDNMGIYDAARKEKQGKGAFLTNAAKLRDDTNPYRRRGGKDGNWGEDAIPTLESRKKKQLMGGKERGGN